MTNFLEAVAALGRTIIESKGNLDPSGELEIAIVLASRCLV